MAAAVSGKGGPSTERLFVLSSTEELARAAAGRLWGIVRERATVLGRAGKPSQRIHVALSGGETPRVALSALSAEPYRSRFPWDLVHFHQVDERWVPPGDPRSNRRMLTESLFSRAPVPEANRHFVDTSLATPAEGAERYEEAMRRLFTDPEGGFPRFDAILLGIGRDGHTASLFPGDRALSEKISWAVVATGGEPHLPRVTMTLPVLCAAAQILFLVAGAEKAQALKAVLAAREPSSSPPAGRVSPRRGGLSILADEAAASLVAGKAAPKEKP